MKKSFLLALMLSGAISSQAEVLDVLRFKFSGPEPVTRPYEIDDKDVMGKAFDPAAMLDWPVSTAALADSPWLETSRFPATDADQALNLMAFAVENQRFAKPLLKIEGVDHYKVFLDGQPASAGEIALIPGTHRIIIKYISGKDRSAAPKVSLETAQDGLLSLREDGKTLFTIDDVMHGERISSASISPDGRYMMASYTTTLRGGAGDSWTKVIDLQSGNVVSNTNASLKWMPRSTRYYFTRSNVESRELVAVDPQTGSEEILCDQLPDGSFTMAPTEDYLILNQTQYGPKEKKDIYQILKPDDRQPGWRNRSYMGIYNLRTGVYQPLTFGYRNNYLNDISSDGKYILFTVSSERLTQRPTSLFSLYRMEVATKKVELLVDNDGFIADAHFSPDGKQVLVKGSPEAFDKVGMRVKEGQTPSMYDYQLYLLDIASKKVQTLTADFDPSVSDVFWNELDGRIYFTASNKDCESLYSMTAKGKIRQIDVPEEIVSSFSLAKTAQKMVLVGESASNWQRIYTLDTKTLKSEVVDNLSDRLLDDVQLGKCEPWNFTNSRGDEICGRFYLPPHFDPNRKYPMIVNYYGGCTPVSRKFATRYPHHAYAALGYVVYVIEPSGAIGFGQEFSARHVNTWGDFVADDIIEGTRKFAQEHAYIDASKIGCIGASYGGFMTQYLQTKTDIFAAAISHAGISSITSYWGEGYWGYSYGEVAQANSYPWNNRDLYTLHSPLYNADKVHTPLLFLHGSVDTNVPIGESIQMFNALKLLGRETAFVVVDDQNHHVMQYDKRIQWQYTIYAWFAKWLQGDDSWWNELYAPKEL